MKLYTLFKTEDPENHNPVRQHISWSTYGASMIVTHWLLTFNWQLCFCTGSFPHWIRSNAAIPTLIFLYYGSYYQSCWCAKAARFPWQIISIKLPFVSCGWWITGCFTVERCCLSFCQYDALRMIRRRLNNRPIWKHKHKDGIRKIKS